jgi:uncharacterized membrane protein
MIAYKSALILACIAGGLLMQYSLFVNNDVYSRLVFILGIVFFFSSLITFSIGRKK